MFGGSSDRRSPDRLPAAVVPKHGCPVLDTATTGQSSPIRSSRVYRVNALGGVAEDRRIGLRHTSERGRTAMHGPASSCTSSAMCAPPAAVVVATFPAYAAGRAGGRTPVPLPGVAAWGRGSAATPRRPHGTTLWSRCVSGTDTTEAQRQVGDRLFERSPGAECVEQLPAEFVREPDMLGSPDLRALIVAWRREARIAITAHRVPGHSAVVRLRTTARADPAWSRRDLWSGHGGTPGSARSIQRWTTTAVTPMAAAAARTLGTASTPAPVTLGRIASSVRGPRR